MCYAYNWTLYFVTMNIKLTKFFVALKWTSSPLQNKHFIINKNHYNFIIHLDYTFENSPDLALETTSWHMKMTAAELHSYNCVYDVFLLNCNLNWATNCYEETQVVLIWTKIVE